ncbi:Heat shock protein DnaJ N-terminal [Penicillium bovifimosum]|uniref:Heat shock protein DnaJ N-terminal n=1 Tax=Penicillium bovifimosum TaxID=126998 RepID=A0A9W9GSS1_9EURO|nr:Heat shock protein DnaJ N-terminal [Penicillium bovifimosum]KAJ5129385.1 Heat shock protein DnaJ N-terminal [Penicillium bovifimosum]
MAKNAKPENHASDEEMPSVEENLYKILGVASDATPEAIKTAYKKSALRNHPDKVSEDARAEANAKFQQIALAYGVLSDARRRSVYDRTGSTDEAFGEDGDFNWADFYHEQLSAMLDSRAISDFQKKYQNSDEERKDLLAAYETHEGDMDAIYDTVMLSNVLDDDERFRGIIDQAIADGEVEDYERYSKESEKKKQARVKKAKKEAREAEKLGKEIEDKKKKKAGAGSKAAANEDDLLAIITKRQQDRGAGFLARLEEKYAQPGKKRGADDEPPEEAFAAVGARKGSKPKSKRAKA